MRLRSWSLAGAFLLVSVQAASAQEVFDAGQLRQAIGRAAPGDIITLMPGRYEITHIVISTGGTADRPITLRAPALGDAKIVPRDDEAFKVAAPHWIFENLDIAGGPTSDNAFHLVGPASDTIIRHNFIHDFNAMIKGNGEGTPRTFPNRVLIEDNILLDIAPRMVDATVTPIDVVGGKDWVVRSNFIADFGKAGGDRISYGAYLKGNSSHGVMERNLVLCEWRTHGGTRVGLSLGGGGTGEGFCDGNSCATEHRDGIIRNNIVANCPEDVGIYLNKAEDTRILGNTLFDTNGIDVRFPVTSAKIDGNIISGGIRSRDGGAVHDGDNLQFGSSMSLAEHKGFERLKAKLLHLANEHPRLFHRTWAEWLAGPIDWTSRLFGALSLGRGDNGMQALFEGAEHENFTLRPSVEGPGNAMPDIVEDFCGYHRNTLYPSYGAIERRDEDCYVPLVMLRAEGLIVRDQAQ